MRRVIVGLAIAFTALLVFGCGRSRETTTTGLSEQKQSGGVRACVHFLNSQRGSLSRALRSGNALERWCGEADRLRMICATGDVNCGSATEADDRVNLCRHLKTLWVHPEEADCSSGERLCPNGEERVEDFPCNHSDMSPVRAHTSTTT